MFCQNCGKQIGKNDNFCRYCGTDVRIQEKDAEENIDKFFEEQTTEDIQYDGEELVLYEVKKHWISLFWPAFLTPLFLIYFLTKFLNTSSFFSWIILFGMLVLIIYPITRYKSDKIVITTKSAHIKIGVINPIELEIPLKDINIIDIKQSSMGRMLDYATLSFCIKSEKYEYPYIDTPEDLQYIIDNPKEFIKESLEENLV